MRFKVFLQTLLTGVGAAHHWRLARHATGGWRGKLRSTESARSFPAKTLLCVSVNRREPSCEPSHCLVTADH